MRREVLCFLHRAGEVCLAKQKPEMSDDKTGYRCVVDSDESMPLAVSKEIWRKAEAVVLAEDVQQRALIRIHRVSDGSKVELPVFVASHWLQGPAETEYYGPPLWFGAHRALFEEVPEAELMWIPHILAGERFDADVHHKTDEPGDVQLILREPTF